MKLEINAVDELFQKILSKNTNLLGRTGTELWLGFGKIIDTVNQEGKPIKKSEYAINIQCSWRIKNKQNHNIVAFYDIFQPNSSTEWSKDFDWNVKGNNLYDEKAKKWSIECDMRQVVSYEISSNLDLTITFSDGDVLEAFIDTSVDRECWRLFKNKSDNHVVASGIDLYIGDEKVFEIEADDFDDKSNPKSG